MLKPPLSVPETGAEALPDIPAFRSREAVGAPDAAGVHDAPQRSLPAASHNVANASNPVTVIHDHDWIAAHIPHHGAMCLLDAVIEWDAQHIVCTASSHRRTDHPLRSRGRLSAVAAIEYAAQAMAAHGAVLAQRGAAPAAGFLTAVRSVRYGVDRLDTIDADLRCEATRVSGDAHNILYAFEVTAGTRAIARGRATVMLDAGAASGDPAPTRN
jgi:predicted hotdog family 3-hydroxylacyl-ACP dehydratase